MPASRGGLCPYSMGGFSFSSFSSSAFASVMSLPKMSLLAAKRGLRMLVKIEFATGWPTPWSWG